ncbi:MAG: bifunctional DNA primase/polymerase [Terracidiphilus sp.]
MALLDVALDCIRRGWYVIPCKPRDKDPLIRTGKGGYTNASNDETQIRAWWAKWPDANVGVAVRPSKLTIVDCDHGLKSEADFYAWREKTGQPLTFTVRTGRRFNKDTGEPEFGVQAYYQTPDEPVSSMAWDEGTHSGDIRGTWGWSARSFVPVELLV